jgi:hypothetical protein
MRNLKNQKEVISALNNEKWNVMLGTLIFILQRKFLKLKSTHERDIPDSIRRLHCW